MIRLQLREHVLLILWIVHVTAVSRAYSHHHCDLIVMINKVDYVVLLVKSRNVVPKVILGVSTLAMCTYLLEKSHYVTFSRLSNALSNAIFILFCSFHCITSPNHLIWETVEEDFVIWQEDWITFYSKLHHSNFVWVKSKIFCNRICQPKRKL